MFTIEDFITGLKAFISLDFLLSKDILIFFFFWVFFYSITILSLFIEITVIKSFEYKCTRAGRGMGKLCDGHIALFTFLIDIN